MNIDLHIERLVLDGVSLAAADRPLLQTTVEVELTRLLASGGLSDATLSGGALDNMRASGIQLGNRGGPVRLGEQIASAVYGGIGERRD